MLFLSTVCLHHERSTKEEVNNCLVSTKMYVLAASISDQSHVASPYSLHLSFTFPAVLVYKRPKDELTIVASLAVAAASDQLAADKVTNLKCLKAVCAINTYA